MRKQGEKGGRTSNVENDTYGGTAGQIVDCVMRIIYMVITGQSEETAIDS